MPPSKYKIFQALQSGYYVPEDAFVQRYNESVKAITEGIKSSWSTLRQLEEFQLVQGRDETLTPGVRKLRIAHYARKRKAEILDQLLGLQEKTIAQIEKLEAKRTESYKPTNPALEARRAAIRHELSNMDYQARVNRITSAIQDSDQDTISAIAVQPHNNSVSPKYQHQQCQELFNREVLGDDDFEILGDLKNGLERLESVALHFDKDMEVDFILPAQDVEAKQTAAAEAFYLGV